MITRKDFFHEGWRSAVGVDHMVTGSAGTVADWLEENFEATGSRGGYMISSPLGFPRGMADVVELLGPELRRRGALPDRQPGRTLKEVFCG